MSPLRTITRAGSLLAVTAATGLGVILADGASQAATISPVTPAAASRATSWQQHWQHIAHLAHLARQTRYGPATLTARTNRATATYPGSGSFQSCVIARESGGNPQIVNPSSGTGGLYQFLPSTWRGLGYSGLPQDAPVAVQNEAFQRLYAQQGRQPWSSDGC